MSISDLVANDESDSDIEKRLLKQLIVKCRKQDIPYSLYKSIPENLPWYIGKIVPLFLSLLVLCILSLIFHDLIEFNKVLLSKDLVISFIFSLSVFIAYAVSSVVVTYYKKPKLNVNAGTDNVGVSAEIESGEDQDPIDKDFTDIVYILEQLYKNPFRKKIIVLEDLDRYGVEECLKVVEKFKELNILINQRLLSNRFLKIFGIKNLCRRYVFLYVLSDEIFKSLQVETKIDRFKFFDVIVPVIPKFGAVNSAYVLESWKNDYNLNPGLINDVSKFVHDYRTIRAIENEFIVFRQAFEISNRTMHNSDRIGNGAEDSINSLNTNIMAFCIYKHFYPEAYYEIFESDKPYFIDKLIEKELIQIKEIIKETKKLEDNSLNCFSYEYMYEPFEENDLSDYLFKYMDYTILNYIVPKSEITTLLDKIIDISKKENCSKDDYKNNEIENYSKQYKEEIHLCYVYSLICHISKESDFNILSLIITTVNNNWIKYQNDNFALAYSEAIMHYADRRNKKIYYSNAAFEIEKIIGYTHDTNDVLNIYAYILFKYALRTKDDKEIARCIDEKYDKYLYEEKRFCNFKYYAYTIQRYVQLMHNTAACDTYLEKVEKRLKETNDIDIAKAFIEMIGYIICEIGPLSFIDCKKYIEKISYTLKNYSKSCTMRSIKLYMKSLKKACELKNKPDSSKGFENMKFIIEEYNSMIELYEKQRQDKKINKIFSNYVELLKDYLECASKEQDESIEKMFSVIDLYKERLYSKELQDKFFSILNLFIGKQIKYENCCKVLFDYADEMDMNAEDVQKNLAKLIKTAHDKTFINNDKHCKELSGFFKEKITIAKVKEKYKSCFE